MCHVTMVVQYMDGVMREMKGKVGEDGRWVKEVVGLWGKGDGGRVGRRAGGGRTQGGALNLPDGCFPCIKPTFISKCSLASPLILTHADAFS